MISQLSPTHHISLDLRPEKRTTKESNTILCVPVMFHKVSVLIRRGSEFVRDFPWSCECQRSDSLQDEMLCYRESSVLWGLFCLLKHWGVYQCILLLSGNLSQTASNIIFSVSVRIETNPSMFGESDEDGSVWDLPCSWTYLWILFTSNAELSYWSNHIKSSED